jgi:DNA mismatch repair protein MutS2
VAVRPDVLEYGKILQMLAAHTQGALAAAEALGLAPVREGLLMRERLAETSEAAAVILRKGGVGLGEYGDIRKALSFAEKGGALTMKELLDVAKHLFICSRARRFLTSDVPEIPHIRDVVSVLTPDDALAKRISDCILSETEMADAASPELKRIRRSIAQANEQIRERLNKIITGRAYADVLQDALVTLRDGRYCIPVKAEYRARVPGIVHDQSKGGATVFIEPQAVVDANNKLRELMMEETKEVQRILAELSADVGASAHGMRLNQDLLVTLDVIFAKGQLSVDMDAVCPVVGADAQRLSINGGRHPLIDKEKVVPISLTLGEGFRVLVITGPNTGGKTVTLKTVGLFVLMAQAGLHLPAVGAEIPAGIRVCADIGDEQSIEQSLSTFSAHMKNLVGILGEADADALVLLDELGAGTDPTEGAALAISILEALKARGSLVLSTTHYTELKKYALDAEGVRNASMEFDVETLSPTYRLIVGTPGRSNAFEISRKLGLDEKIIARARERMDEGSLAFENVIGRVEEDRLTAERDRQEAAALLADVQAREAAFEKKRARFEESRERVLEKARETAAEKIEDAEDYAQIVRAELKALLDDAKELAERAGGGASDAQSARGDYYRRLDENKKLLGALKEDFSREEKGAGKAAARGAALSAKNIKVGQRVRLKGSDEQGEVLTLPNDKKEVQILLGSLKLWTPLKNLEAVGDGGTPKKQVGARTAVSRGAAPGSSSRLQKRKEIAASINVIGEDLETARVLVEKYLDDALLAGLTEASIVHGRGAGILRDGLRKMLRANKNIKTYRPGGPGEGGDGVTVVTFRT